MTEPPGEEQGRGGLHKQRLRWLLNIVAVCWLIFFLQQTARGAWHLAAMDIVGFGLTVGLSLWVGRSNRASHYAAAAHLAMAVSSIGVFGVCMWSGQELAVASWYYAAIPLFAAYTLGTRAAVAWTAISIILVLGVHFSPEVVSFEPDYLPTRNITVVSQVILTMMVLGLSVATRRVTDSTLDVVEQREQIIRERAAEVAEARDAALAAAKTKDLFLANMSHEIRTPLNGIIGMTSVLLDADQSEEQREMVRTIQRSSSTLLAVLNEVLDFSKLEADAVELERIPFDLRECVEDAVDLLGRTAFEKGLELYVHTALDVPRWVDGDITYVRQVLINLLGNAIKFTDSGEVCVRVATDGPGTLHFRVCDTGIGIPEDKHELAFESFSQVDPSTTRKYGGTGLGLAISKRLVRLMGGELWLESTPGLGSTFHFTIEAPMVEPPARSLTTGPRVALTGRQVHMMGGQEGPRRAMQELLTSWGLSVDEFSQEATELEGVEVLIVYDDHLDDLSKLSPRPPTILLAHLPDADIRARADHERIEAIVFRPLRYRALRQALETIILGEPTDGPSFSQFDPTMGERLPARILIAEDNPINQRVAVTVLEKLGYDPDVVADGREVLAALDRRQYEILFLDLQMPDMDGFETTQAILKRGDTDHPWIVALTASNSTDQRERVADVGMDDFVSKPFDVQTLMAAIERWSEQGASAGGPTESSSDASPAVVASDVEDSPWVQLRAMFEGAPDKLARLVEDHLQNAEALVSTIVSASQADEPERVGVAAHTLKSSAAQFGSDELARVALEIEKRVRVEPSYELSSTVDLLLSEWEKARDRLGAIVSELRSLAPEAL